MATSVASLKFSSLSLGSSTNAAVSSRSSSFVSLNGLSTFSRNFSQASEKNQSLVIEARNPTRREKVKVRHMRIRRKLSGTTERPRLAVFRSNKHIYVQVIDDTQSHTLAAASTLSPSLKEELNITSGPTIEAAKRVGEEIAKKCLEKGIQTVCFDRGGFIYHGRISALADGAREGGLVF